LDYTHRNADGTVDKFADSVMHEFKTKDGRSVYDGSAIYPDVLVKQERFSNITQALVGKLMVFDYATTYRNAHASLTNPKTFALSDGEYNEFVKFLSGKDYVYTKPSEKLLKELKTEITKEKDFTDIRAEFDALQAKLASAKGNDLEQHKSEIKQVLENEIASRYYYEKGRYECNFRYDRELDKAVKVMQDKNMVASILKGEGSYKTIGKPGPAMAAAKAEAKNKD
jgi:carboxyl-terminal processing protease